MTMNTKLAAALASACAAAAIAGGTIATAGATHTNSGNQLMGTWTVAVSRPGPLPPLTSLQLYTGAGSMVESANDTASRSPQYGSWERTEGREYAYTGAFFRFDPATGVLVGKQKINRTIDLSEDGQSFTFHGRVTIYDAHDNVVANVPVSGTGERLDVETRP